MSDIDGLRGDLSELSADVLSDLSSEERVRAFAKEAAAGNDEFLEQLADTAPEGPYNLSDPWYIREIQKLGAISLQARFELQTRYQAIRKANADRNMYTALFLLNESLSRLSRDRFKIDEWGHIQVEAQSDGESTDGHSTSRGPSYLTSRYQSLWQQIPQAFLDEEGGRLAAFMENLHPPV